MTNADYIKSRLTDSDIASMIGNFNGSRSILSDKAYDVWHRWAESVTSNHGNMAGRDGIEDPSVWYWERWCYPGNKWKRMGRTQNVSIQVWLSMQYKPEEWDEEGKE